MEAAALAEEAVGTIEGAFVLARVLEDSSIGHLTNDRLCDTLGSPSSWPGFRRKGCYEGRLTSNVSVLAGEERPPNGQAGQDARSVAREYRVRSECRLHDAIIGAVDDNAPSQEKKVRPRPAAHATVQARVTTLVFSGKSQ